MRVDPNPGPDGRDAGGKRPDLRVELRHLYGRLADQAERIATVEDDVARVLEKLSRCGDDPTARRRRDKAAHARSFAAVERRRAEAIRRRLS